MAGINAQDAAVVCSLALQHGVPLDAIRRALMRDGNGRASGPLATALDIARREGGCAMSRLPDHLNPPAIKINVQRLACFDCGSETNATCTCGVAYLPRRSSASPSTIRPTRANRHGRRRPILAFPRSTVSDARAVVRDRTPETPERVTGRDNKSYAATKPRSRTVADPTEAAIEQIFELFKPLAPADRDRVQDGLDRIREDETSEGGS